MREDPQVLRNEKKILLAFAGIFFASAFFSSGMRIRYISPMIPPLVLLSVFAIRKMVNVVSGLGAKYLGNMGFVAIFLILSFSFWLNASYTLDQYKYVDPFNYLKGTLTRDEYIEKYRLEYPAMRYINENLTPRDKVLFIFMGNRGYYCDREYVFDMNNNRSTLRQLVKRSDKPEEVVGGLKEMGITHLLINDDIFNRWVKMNFTQKDQQLLQALFKKYVKLLFFKRGYGVSRLENFD